MDLLLMSKGENIHDSTHNHWYFRYDWIFCIRDNRRLELWAAAQSSFFVKNGPN